MWTIRQEQVESLEHQRLQTFEDEMVGRLLESSPQHCKAAGEAAVRQTIRFGIENAKKYGFTNRGPVHLYVELMFIFGSYFDDDPQHLWAGAVLRDPNLSEQMYHADRLFAAVNEYKTQVFGPQQKHELEAVKRLAEMRMEKFPAGDNQFHEKVLRALQEIYPRRCEYLGRPTLSKIVARGFELARPYAFSANGALLMTALTFSMGHRFYRDPLFPWIAKILADPRSQAPGAREERLYGESVSFLKDGLAGAGEA